METFFDVGSLGINCLENERWLNLSTCPKLINFDNFIGSDYGRLYNLKTKKHLKGGLLEGYHRYTLSNMTFKKKIDGHRLVGLLFIPNPENKLTVDHIVNGKRHDNHYLNLRWATMKEQNRNKSQYGSQRTSIHTGISRHTENSWRVRFAYTRYDENNLPNRCDLNRFFKTEEEAVAQRNEWISTHRQTINTN